MDLDDLRAEWAKRDEALQQTLRLQGAVLRELMTEKERAKLQRVGATSIFELIVYIAFVAGFGMFLAANWGRWEFFIPALLLDVWTIAMGALTFAERARLRAIDFSQPVLDIQKQLSALRIERVRTVQWAFLTGQVLWWIPFVIVLFWGLLGVDLYRVSDFMPIFIASNIGVGLAIIPLALVIAHIAGPRMENSKLGRSFLDSISGRDLAEANALATRIARFEAAAA